MTGKVQVTYHAPDSESKICEIGGKTFYDGKPTELDHETDKALIEKLKANTQFEVPGGGAGAPSKSEAGATTPGSAHEQKPAPGSQPQTGQPHGSAQPHEKGRPADYKKDEKG